MCAITSAWAVPQYEADVRVDVTDKSVDVAKQKAMTKAVRDGLNEVTLNISTEKSVAELNKLTDNQIQHFILGVQVLMEKASDVRYIADLRVSVDEKLLSDYLKENGLPLVMSGETSVLLLPLWEKADGSLDLWSDENVWRQALLERGKLRRGTLAIRVMDKNLGNIATAVPEKVYNMSDGMFRELASFNNADVIYVVKYSEKDGVVQIKSFPERVEDSVKIDATPEQTIDAVLPYLKAPKKAVPTEEEASDVVQTKLLDVVYAYPNLGKWMSLKKILADNPQAGEVTVVTLGKGQVHFTFQYSGELEKLQGNLALSGYKMRPEGGYYVIY
jgi:hypothetical protein